MANQTFIDGCTSLAVTYDLQTDPDLRDKTVYYIIIKRNNEVERNVEARSRNHCCSGETINISFS
jgi:hypothetical protein